jgi:predicted TIM-barrel fold metal-dependent hydrolase
MPLEALLRIADPERIFYGSDWPFTPMAAVKDAASGLDATSLLEGNLQQAVMMGNALKLFADFTSGTSA